MKLRIFAVFCTLIFLFSVVQLSAQDISNLTFINELADRKSVTFEEAVRFFVLATGERPGNFKKNIRILQTKDLLKDIDEKKDSKLRRGVISLMISSYLDLKDSLLYKFFKTERYAFRACVANGIMHYNGSEWDIIGGGELIEIMDRVTEMSGGKE